jgi:parvulin-like peptidyl-prolyl isomerase
MTRRLFFFLWLLALLCLVAVSCSSFAVAAATVNGQKITEAQVETELDRVRGDPTFSALLRPQAEEARGTTRRQILTGLVRQVFLEQEARRLDLRVTRVQEDRLLAQEAARQGLTVPQFRKQQNLTAEDARTLAERVVRLFQVCGKVVRPVQLRDSQLRAAYEQQKSALEEVHLARITVATEAEIRKALEQISAGDFSSVARSMSKDPSAAQGGDVGHVRLSTLSPDEQATVRRTDTGRVTDPINTGNAFEVFRVLDRRTPSFSDVRQDLNAQLSDQESQQRCTDWLNRRLRAARIVVNPKYGRFDDKQLAIVAGSRELRP